MNKYRYPRWLRLFSMVPSIFFILGLFFCIDWIVIELGMVNGTIFGKTATINYESYLKNGLTLLFFGLYFLSNFNEIDIVNEGIKVSVFYFYWIFIPWGDIIDITTYPIPGFSNPSISRIIKVRKFTIFHRLSGIIYFTGIHPIISINKYISNYDDLVNSIESNLLRIDT